MGTVDWFVALLTCCALLTSANSNAQLPGGDVGVDEHVGASLERDLRLIEADGRSTTLGEALGDRPAVVVLAYSRCSMLCSLVLRGVVAAVKQLPGRIGRDYRVITVSIDPSEGAADATRQQQALLRAVGATEPSAWLYLRGDDGAIHALADRLGFRYSFDPTSKQFAHPSVIFVVGADGTIRRYLYGIEFRAREIDAALNGVVERGASRRVASSLLQCFRFDPRSRRYGWVVVLIMQGGALVVATGLVAGVALLQRRSRVRR